MSARRAAGHSPGTIKLHRTWVLRLAIGHEHPRLTTAQLVDFLSHDGWAPETRKSARAALRSFYRWAHASGRLPEDPSEALPSVRVPPAMPRPCPEHLVRQIVKSDDRVGRMAMLAAYCGLRRGEIARLHSSDLVGDELRVHGKGGKVREVPVTYPPLLEWLQGLDGWAFPNGQGGHLTAGHVGRLLSRAMPDGWTAHTLRHRMASAAYAGTRDLLAVSEVLGHSRPETTRRYVRLPDDAVRAAVRAASSF